MRRKPKLTQAEQSRRFIEAANEAGVDADALERIVRRIAKPAAPKSTKGNKKKN